MRGRFWLWGWVALGASCVDPAALDPPRPECAAAPLTAAGSAFAQGARSTVPSDGWSELAGAPIGRQARDNARSRRALAVRLLDSPDYEIVYAFVLESPSSLIVAVRNRAAAARCRIEALHVHATATAELGEFSFLPEFAGSFGQQGGALDTRCLSAGETGYFLAAVSGAELAALDLQLTGALGEVERPGFRLTPESYRSAPDTQTLDIMLKNYGYAAAPLTRSARVTYILADDDGAPLAWGELPFIDASAVPPGRATHAAAHVELAGESTRLFARLQL